MWFGQKAAAWQDVAAFARTMAGNNGQLRSKFWRKLLREAASLPFAEQLLAAYYCAFDRRTPLYVKAVLLGAIAYFVVPDRLLPKNIPLIGYADDAAVLAAAIKAVSSHMMPEHREAARRRLAQLCSEAQSRS